MRMRNLWSALAITTLALGGCSPPTTVESDGGEPPIGSGGVTGGGGNPGSGGRITGSGGRITGSGGMQGSGGRQGSGGNGGAGGLPGSGGRVFGSGGRITGSGGAPGSGGRITGSGGAPGSGGRITGSGGAPGSGGSGPDCSATMPSGGSQNCSGTWAQGTAAGLTWTRWSNNAPANGSCITTYNTPAFSASWNGAGDFLARLGLNWNSTKTYDQYGTITAQFAETKSGTAGGYSFIGVYGWSGTSPCVEFYIVEDSYGGMPFNPGNTTNKGTVTIDGGEYILYLRHTTGTGGSACTDGSSSWDQFYSMRKTARTCGTISVTEHFNAWKAAGMNLGKMGQVQVFVETGGGTGSINFPVANVTAR